MESVWNVKEWGVKHGFKVFDLSNMTMKELEIIQKQLMGHDFSGSGIVIRNKKVVIVIGQRESGSTLLPYIPIRNRMWDLLRANRTEDD